MIKYKGPIVAIVMDGIGLSKQIEGNAVALAYKPTLDRLMNNYPLVPLMAHGKAVGLPSDDDMGNSEVGHNAIGSGQVFSQGAMLVNQSIASGAMFKADGWIQVISNVKLNKSTLHFLGLFSDGNVHSHINHLKAMIEQAKLEGIASVRIHILLDGRDVGETSALEYILPFENFLESVRSNDFDICIASGGGRMNITMDRYESDWSMVQRGWHTHVLGEGRAFKTAALAVETYRSETGVIDQYLPAFVIVDENGPVGKINDGDSVVFFNFRGDRSQEISRTFEDKVFDHFDRIRFPKVTYAGMLEYDGDLHIPSRYLVNPPIIKHTLSELLASRGLNQLAISETQKFGHVTYFWNGNKSGKFNDELETYIEIPSDVIPFEQKPWMKAVEITEELIAQLKTGKFQFARVNFPNGDMVGHTGNMLATRISVETVDLVLSRLLPVIDQLGGMAIITADHGNADEMYEFKKGKLLLNEKGNPKSKTSHTLNPVPCIFYDNTENKDKYIVKGCNTEGGKPVYGLSNIAASVAVLLGLEKPAIWDESIIEEK